MYSVIGFTYHWIDIDYCQSLIKPIRAQHTYTRNVCNTRDIDNIQQFILILNSTIDQPHHESNKNDDNNQQLSRSAQSGTAIDQIAYLACSRNRVFPFIFPFTSTYPQAYRHIDIHFVAEYSPGKRYPYGSCGVLSPRYKASEIYFKIHDLVVLQQP